MKLVETYSVFQWLIVKRMIELLKDDTDLTKESWAAIKLDQARELNDYVISELLAMDYQVIEAIKDDYDEAYNLIGEHLFNEFGEIAGSPDELLDGTIGFINRDVITPLYSSSEQVGVVETAYKSIIDEVIKSDEQLTTALELAILYVLQDGLDSGFISKAGYRWKLDRTIGQINKHIYLDLYKREFRRLSEGHTELVRVFEYVNPRDACVKLQNSGIIAIKPRSVLSEENQHYPNIWDVEHKYTEPSGHHGIHCRHSWHNINSQTDNSETLYNPIDEIALAVEVSRLRYKNLLKKYA